MKPARPSFRAPFCRRAGACLAALTALLATGPPSARSAPPAVQPLLQGRWPGWSRGTANEVKVQGRYAYVAVGAGGLTVIDVRNPANCVRMGGYNTSGNALGVTVSGNYACVADGAAGLQVIDVSNPANCVLVANHRTRGQALGVSVVANRIYVADGEAGLLVLPSLANVQFTVRVDAAPGTPFTLEAATDLFAPNPWTPLLTTNVPAMPFDFVDFDVKTSAKPQKYYRVRQP